MATTIEENTTAKAAGEALPRIAAVLLPMVHLDWGCWSHNWFSYIISLGKSESWFKKLGKKLF